MMPSQDTAIIDSNPRFQQPGDWQWGYFNNAHGCQIRFGTVSPTDKKPDAIIVCLAGLSEFAEKYFEVAHDVLEHNCAFWIMDWPGQGLSHRYLKNLHKRHSVSFENDIDDFHFFVKNYVLKTLSDDHHSHAPLVMLAHSMGGNIGMRYLIKHPGIFSCAAFSAPMTNIAALRHMPTFFAIILSIVLRWGFDKRYVLGGKDWSAAEREVFENNIFSSDPIRSRLHNAWCIRNPALQVGSVTFGWAYHALKSCRILRAALRAKPLSIRSFIAVAGQDRLVDNKRTSELMKNMPETKLLSLPKSNHEIMMESASIRKKFMGALFNLVTDCKMDGANNVS